MNPKPILAITMGDPAGVGPEIIAKALSNSAVLDACRPVILGSMRAMLRAFASTGTSFPVHEIDEPALNHPPEGILLLNDESMLGETIPLATIDATCGEAAYAWLAKAIRLANAGVVDAIVTAPLHKEALHQAGHVYAGHTEILADHTGTTEFSLMLLAERFRVVHVTCHVAMKDVPALLTRERVSMTIRLFHEALTRLDGKAPRIAVCAYNPHAGEGGLFGREELDVIAPAVQESVAAGIQAEGPFSSDSIYPQVIGGRFDGVVAMYHDQGHIPFKLMHFGFDESAQAWNTVTGVNITLGLPIIRTSVDHGTAFDLAGTGQASERSLLDAIHTAVRLTRSR